MTRNFVITLTGADRIGIVEELTRLLLERGGNVESSRMARLGGEFAVLMLVSMPEDQISGLDSGLDELFLRGYRITTTPTDRPVVEARPGWVTYHIEVEGADHEGIIHRVASHLSARGISIEEMETETASAPFGGVTLFNMSALVVVPPELVEQGWEAGLDAIGGEMNLEIRVSPEKEG
ncbi:glycine cleavage system protein R [Tautonia plasticadhaerens]|uniref:Glycine cleavage system transcriptional repressor n=1 Tax=Tautonia plasticadhaerens TaxID=2527974 RepID=A0A518GYY0_9BACT|nr:ACT domain-containing protein [Tautonia plasticadhaerens]QDV33777.1 Glycine cleavage system transcriptional repressor [Tautonia plasticadhaerens]